MPIRSKSALWGYRIPVVSLINILQILDDFFWDRLSLHVPIQEQNNWCWAACSNGVSHYYDAGSTWAQCSIANDNLGRSDCCGTGASGPCNVYGFLAQALTTVGHFDHSAAQAADFATVDTEIDAKRPLGVRVAWGGGGAHFVCIGGYRELPSPSVHVEDPWYGPSDIAYSTLKSGYHSAGTTWTHTYWTKP